MAQADRLHAGAPFISANNLNKTIEQGNRLDAFQGGPGIDSQNDATGFQLRNNRRRPVLDGDTPYNTSTPLRRTMHRRINDGTRHANEYELFNSSNVSSRAVAPLFGTRPQRYGIPFLPTSSNGSGDMLWMSLDADEFGTSGPRSLERRSSSSGERAQIYGFDKDISVLDSSDVADIAIRRGFGSSENDHSVAWIGVIGLLDDLSLDVNDRGRAQVFDWDHADGSESADLGAALFPYKDKSTSGLLYSSGNSLLEFIEDFITIDPTRLDLDFQSIDLSVFPADRIELYQWDTAQSNNAAANPISTSTLIPAKRRSGTSFEDELVYYTVSEITGLGQYWALGGDNATAYGQSIGNAAAAKVIDLDDRELVGGPWGVTNTTAAADGVGGLVLGGGMYAAKGIYVDKGEAALAALFSSSTASQVVRVADGTNALHATDGGGKAAVLVTGDDEAARFEAGGARVKIFDGTYGVNSSGAGYNVSGSNYHHSGLQVVGVQLAAVTKPAVTAVAVSVAGADQDSVARTEINKLIIDVAALKASQDLINDALSLAAGGHGLTA